MSECALFACQKCGEEYGEGEEQRGLSLCCMREGDPTGGLEICDALECGMPFPCSNHPVEMGLTEVKDGE